MPEISLTPQTVRRLSNYFKNEIAILHSRLSDGERFDAWNGIRNGKYKIVIGARSAVFVPLENIKLIIVDEEHESSYKQFDSSPNYNARDVAILRAQKQMLLLFWAQQLHRLNLISTQQLENILY